MKKEITFWQDGDFWLGYLNEYPDYLTQGLSKDELFENLKDIYQDIVHERLPGKRNTIELEIA